MTTPIRYDDLANQIVSMRGGGQTGFDAQSARQDALKQQLQNIGANAQSAQPVGSLINQTNKPLAGNTGSGVGAELVKYAQSLQGAKYVWGATGQNNTYDCSGLVQSVFKRFGYNLPRVSAQQARAGREVSMAEAQPGDLVSFDNSSRNNGADHIGIYIGNGMYVNAPHTGAVVRTDRVGPGARFTRVLQ